jgi:hypothetical protein
MIRNVRTPRWKALLAVSVAGAALLWHVLACMESPMAFSPGGKHLAFVATEYGKATTQPVAGERHWRLIVVSEAKRARLVEQTDRYMLTAPAYSPNGQHLCYFRVALPTRREAEKLRQDAERRREQLKALEPFRETRLASEPDAGAAATSQPFQDSGGVRSLPSLSQFVEFWQKALLNPRTAAVLVVRDAVALDVVVATVRMELPLLDFTQDDPAGVLGATYMF